MRNSSYGHIRRSLAFVTFLSLGGAFGCADKAVVEEQSYDLGFDVKEVMGHVLDPAADVIWGSAGYVATIEGEISLEPTTEEGWHAVENAAAVVIESGNLLKLPGRAVDQKDWIEISSGLSEVGKRALAAAEAEDPATLFEVGGELYQVCLSCHQLYIVDAVVDPTSN